VSTPNDGSPAFPSDVSNGMTLRDFFAAATLAGLHSNPNINREVSDEDMAAACYHMADVMITKRNEEAAK
jgi:hypothetical protein